jgi:hypothetical protein
VLWAVGAQVPSATVHGWHVPEATAQYLPPLHGGHDRTPPQPSEIVPH